ncbi:glycosyltransferase family 2 protein [Frondihabitans cladoniiphilus]|uniref:Glycosyltransferase n=1 Tax=Frondihabitans cladoniiphilus TaxID=715785 RepID=A0ABP8VZ75_9MICO
MVVNYNYERFLADAVRSVLDQTVPFDEIIVVDDGSTDDSLRVLEAFGDRIRVIAKANGGPLSAAWAAVDATDCDYFYLLDADDRAAQDLVSAVTPLLATDPVKIQFQLTSMDVDGRSIDSTFPTYAEGYSSVQMIRDNEILGFYVCAPTSGNLFRTSYLEALRGKGLDEREAYDGVPAQLAPYFGDILSVNRALAHYRVHETSLSSWSRPTPELVDRELTRYRNRWSQVLRILETEGIPAPDPSRSAFVSERTLMAAVLTGRRPGLAPALRHASSILRSGRSLPQKIAFSGWGLALVVVPKKKATELVLAKRSARQRGRLLSTVAKVARARKPAVKV